MKIDVHDRELLSALAPSEVAAYLRSRGWHEQASGSRDWASFTLVADYEATLPLSKELRDFPFRIADVLRTLERVENRNQLEIFLDLRGNRGRPRHAAPSDHARIVITNIVDPDIKEIKSHLQATGTRIIRWIVGSMIVVASVAFASARFLH